MTLLSVDNLSVHAASGPIVAPVSFAVGVGERVTLIGETGSGKSLIAQALLGILPEGLRASGTVRIAGETVSLSEPETLGRFWGRTISVLPQEPVRALDPLMRAHRQVAETHALVGGTPDADGAARSDLAALDLSEAERAYPFELSGGMAQRLAIAAARAGGARIVVADEPTKGLDHARRDEVGRQMNRIPEDGGALLTITHDLDLARTLAGEVLVIREGGVVERGPSNSLLSAPAEPYTRELIAAEPRNWPAPSGQPSGEEVLRAENLSVARGDRVLASGLDLSFRAGEIVGVTGPSGCGKSSLGDTLLGLLRPHAGRVVRAQGHASTQFQKLWQDPPSAFAPHRPLGRALEDLRRRHSIARDALPPLLDRLALTNDLLERRPDEVSGGELQRLSLARALLLDPVFIVADEPTSRLDPLTQRSVIRFLVEIARERGTALLLVSHDPDLVANVTDRSITVGPNPNCSVLAFGGSG